jgi:hypothetical protein
MYISRARTMRPFLLIVVLALAGMALPATAAVTCASTPQQVLTALLTNSGAVNDIRIRSGYYALTNLGGGAAFRADLSGTLEYRVSGSWNSDCSAQSLLPQNATVLDGQGTVGIFAVDIIGAGTFRLSRLTLFNGTVPAAAPFSSGCADVVAEELTSNATVSVEHVRFDSCRDGSLRIQGSINEGLVRNNLFIEGQALGGPDLLARSSSGPIRINNNTFRGTTITIVSGTVISGLGDGQVVFSNNLVAETVLPSGAVELRGENLSGRNNRLLSQGGANNGSPILLNTITANPGFLNASNARLAANSPLRDAGYSVALGGVGDTDLDGSMRVQGAAVEIGAFELAPGALLLDGFEAPAP